jgi:hypothetical protein
MRRVGLGLLAALLVTLACTYMFGLWGDEDDPVPAADRKDVSFLVGPRAGRWHEPRTHADDADLTDEQRAEIERLEALGYAQGLHAGSGQSGVTRHEPDRTDGGVTLYTPAHAAMARLINMEGEVLHEWSFPYDKVHPKRKRTKDTSFWRRTFLFENGDLLALYEGLELIKIDKNSKLLWVAGVRAHNDLEVLDDGTIYVLTREAHIIEAISTERPVLEDFVSILSPDGKETDRISLIDAMRPTAQGKASSPWPMRVLKNNDLFHTNSLEVLDGLLEAKNPAFRRGNILLSMLTLDLVCVLDPETRRIVWGEIGPYARQHDAQVLESGVVMIFDNQGAGPETSRILELDPVTWEPIWSFPGTDREPFYSETCGLAQRLKNGNTLITESDYGRAFEITRGGDVVWEFYNPERAGPDDRYIATLMEMRRLRDDFPLGWAEKPEKPEKPR